MEIVGITKTRPTYEAKDAVKKGYPVYVPKESLEAFEAAGVPVAGTVVDMIEGAVLLERSRRNTRRNTQPPERRPSGREERITDSPESPSTQPPTTRNPGAHSSPVSFPVTPPVCSGPSTGSLRTSRSRKRSSPSSEGVRTPTTARTDPLMPSSLSSSSLPTTDLMCRASCPGSTSAPWQSRYLPPSCTYTPSS